LIQTLKISEIKFDRSDQNEDEIKVLAESIKEQGLLHPITINVHEVNKTLISGKKRSA